MINFSVKFNFKNVQQANGPFMGLIDFRILKLTCIIRWALSDQT